MIYEPENLNFMVKFNVTPNYILSYGVPRKPYSKNRFSFREIKTEFAFKLFNFRETTFSLFFFVHFFRETKTDTISNFGDPISPQ